MATIDDILNKKDNTGIAGVISNPEDNPSGSRGERTPINTTQPPVQAQEQTQAVTPPANPSTEIKVDAEPSGTPKPHKPQPNVIHDDQDNNVHTVTEKPVTEEPEEKQEPQATEFQPLSFYKNFKPEEYAETEDERKAREKKEKREAILATLADGFAAFHNAYAHARGVQPMQNIGGNVSRLRQRLDKEKKEREDKGYKLYDMMQRQKQFEANENWRKSQLEVTREGQEVRKGELQARKDKIALDEFTSEWKRDIAQGTLDVKKRQQEIDEEFKKGRISIEARNAASKELMAQASMIKAQNPGSMAGYVVTEERTDKYGNKVTVRKERKPNPVTTTTTTTPTNNGGEKGKGYGSNNKKGRGY